MFSLLARARSGLSRAGLLLASMALLLAMPVLVSCGGPAPATGTLVGSISMRGGIMQPQRVQAKVTATRTGAGPTQTYSTETTDKGTFEMDLPPGTWLVTATLTKRNSGDQATPEEISVRAGETTHVEIFVNYP